jgi:hypothetical protein
LNLSPIVNQAATRTTSNPGYVPPVPPNAGDVETGAAAPVPTEFDVDPETLKQMGNYLLALRVLYMTTAIFLGVAAGLSLVGQTDLGLIFFALYVLFFSFLICCFEVGLTVSLHLVITAYPSFYVWLCLGRG